VLVHHREGAGPGSDRAAADVELRCLRQEWSYLRAQHFRNRSRRSGSRSRIFSASYRNFGMSLRAAGRRDSAAEVPDEARSRGRRSSVPMDN